MVERAWGLCAFWDLEDVLLNMQLYHFWCSIYNFRPSSFSIYLPWERLQWNVYFWSSLDRMHGHVCTSCASRLCMHASMAADGNKKLNQAGTSTMRSTLAANLTITEHRNMHVTRRRNRALWMLSTNRSDRNRNYIWLATYIWLIWLATYKPFFLIALNYMTCNLRNLHFPLSKFAIELCQMFAVIRENIRDTTTLIMDDWSISLHTCSARYAHTSNAVPNCRCKVTCYVLVAQSPPRISINLSCNACVKLVKLFLEISL